MEKGKSKVSPLARTTLVSNEHFQRSDLRAEDLQGTWRIMDRLHGKTKSMVVVTCPACAEFGLLSDHKVLANGVVSPSMDCQNEDCSYHTWITLDNWDFGVLDNRGEVTRMVEPNLKQQKAEWELWKDLCLVLKDVKAVTQEDIEAKPPLLDTAGQRVLTYVRAWGNALVTVRGVKPLIPDPVMLGLVTQLVPGILAREPVSKTDGEGTREYLEKMSMLDGDEAVVKKARALAAEILKQCSHS